MWKCFNTTAEADRVLALGVRSPVQRLTPLLTRSTLTLIYFPLWGFKSFEAAQCTLTGVELMHMLKKRQQLPLTDAQHRYAALA